MDFITKVNVNTEDTVEKMKKKRAKKLLSYAMGSDLHEAWRAGRKKEDGTFEPRIKKTKDKAYIEAHEGKNEVDIANLSFEELPSDWQYENLEAAKVAIDLVFDMIMGGVELTKEMIEDMSSTVHEEWLKRNEWVYSPEDGDPNLAKPYAELIPEEKAKDRIQIRQAMEKVMRYKIGEISLYELNVKYGHMVRDEKMKTLEDN